MITPVLENYLKTILKMNRSGGEARVTRLAKCFGVTKATVSQTVKKLIRYGLLKKDACRCLRLTEEGKAKAVEIQKRNQILLCFLTDVLGIDKQTSEKDACKMEHYVSLETLQKLEGCLPGQTVRQQKIYHQ